MFIKAFVGGKPYAFIFDTGGAAILDPDLQRQQRYPVIGHVHVVGIGDTEQDVDLVRIPSASIGTAGYLNGAFIVVAAPVRSSPFPGLRFGGILGREFFKNLVTTIDYQRSILTLSENASFHADPAAATLPMTLENDIPAVPASIDGHAGRFRIDSGSGSGIGVTKDFAQSSGLLIGLHNPIPVVIGRGVGGLATGTAVRAKTLSLDGFRMKNPVVTIADSTTGIYANANFSGDIGGEILRRFTVTLDVPRAMLYLRPNARFTSPINFNRAGIFSGRVQTDSENILFVVPASPAARADVLAGDIILKIDDTPVARLSDYQIAEIWQRAPGTTLHLELRRAGKTVLADIVLRDLV